MDIKGFKAWAESKKLSTDGETGRNYSYTFYDSKTQAAWYAWQAKAVPEGFVLVDKHQLAQLMVNMDSFGKKALGDDYVSFADIAEVLDEAREPAND